MSDELVVLTRFAHALREAGLRVGTGRVAEFCHAAALLEPHDLYWAGRATLATGPQEIVVYDRVFGEFFGQQGSARSGERVQVSGAHVEQAIDVGLASPFELLREKSFARCTDEELEALADLMMGTPVTPPRRRSRRLARSSRGLPDLRRTLRRSLRTGGEPLERAWRRRQRRPRRIVFLLDVSGSMADFSRALVLFAHATVRADSNCEVFCFGTRLTRLTAALRVADPDEALALAAGLALDRNAGTRIGESLKSFLDEFGHRGLARGALVVVCSDGLEIGEPAMLAEQAERLSRLAHRVVWLNPLKGDPAYEPLARGMRAALPHVDELASAHNLASLESLAGLLASTRSIR